MTRDHFRMGNLSDAQQYPRKMAEKWFLAIIKLFLGSSARKYFALFFLDVPYQEITRAHDFIFGYAGG